MRIQRPALYTLVAPLSFLCGWMLFGKTSLADLLPRAQKGDPAAQYELGKALYEGTDSLPDRPSGARWMCEAAWQGNNDAAIYIARIYEMGLPGDSDGASAPGGSPKMMKKMLLPQPGVNNFQATKKKMAKGSPSLAATNGAANLQAAYYWLAVAAQHGRKSSKDLTRVSQRLNYEDVVTVEEAAKSWAPIHSQPWSPSGKCEDMASTNLFKRK